MTAKVVHRSEGLEEGATWYHISLAVTRTDTSTDTSIVIHTNNYDLFDQFRVGQECDLAAVLVAGGSALRQKVQ